MLSEALRKRLYFNSDVVSSFTSLFAVLQVGYGLALVRTNLPGKGILLGRTRLCLVLYFALYGHSKSLYMFPTQGSADNIRRVHRGGGGGVHRCQ